MRKSHHLCSSNRLVGHPIPLPQRKVYHFFEITRNLLDLAALHWRPSSNHRYRISCCFLGIQRQSRMVKHCLISNESAHSRQNVRGPFGGVRQPYCWSHFAETSSR